jgi:GT2 family glycosyltransferase
LSVSVIVPVHNGGPVFARCLESLLGAYPAPDEIIVVDDCSTDGSGIAAQRHDVTLVRTDRQRGPAAARNQGARAARGDLLFFVDADVTLPVAALDTILPLFRHSPDVAAVIGSYDDEPPAPNLLSQYKNLLHHHVHQQASEEGFTFWGACGVIRRHVFLEREGFDERYQQPCIEDIRLGYRLKAAGHRIRVCKELQVKHWKRWGAASLLRSDFCLRAMPWTALILEAGRLENDLNISRASRARVVLACVLLAVLGAACWWPPALALAALLTSALLALDAPLLRFFQKKRGLWFAVRTIPWHWFSHVYCGLAFAFGLARHHLSGRRKSAGQPEDPAPRLCLAPEGVENT